jgi:hypothetical protein
MGGRWHKTYGRIHIFYGKGNENLELCKNSLCIRESYHQLGGLRLLVILCHT